MKQFKFRLQTVLEHRQRLETQAMLSFAQAQTALAHAQGLRAELEQIRADVLCELTERRSAPDFDPHETPVYMEYVKSVTVCLRDQEVRIQVLAARAESLRTELVEASQDRQVLDKMRDQHQTAHVVLGRAVEQAVIDDAATSRYNAKSRQASESL